MEGCQRQQQKMVTFMKNNKSLKNSITLVITACILAMVFIVPTGMKNIFAEEEELPFNRTKVSFPALTLELGKKAAEKEKTYTFELTADDKSNPLPKVTKIELTKAGEADFGDVIFERPGDYYYTVKQTTEDELGFVLDSSVYKIRVFAYLIDEQAKDSKEIVTPDKLVATVIISKEGDKQKSEKVLFKNDYEIFDLRIEKDLRQKENVEGRTDPATFVFSVDLFWKDELIKSDVVSMVFNSPGRDYVMVKDIPAGVQAVVTEIYAGGNYRVVGTGMKTTVIGPEETNNVEFTNTYDDTWKGGGSVTNTISDGSTASGSYSDGHTDTFGSR